MANSPAAALTTMQRGSRVPCGSPGGMMDFENPADDDRACKGAHY
jgi:hypothetical protein